MLHQIGGIGRHHGFLSCLIQAIDFWSNDSKIEKQRPKIARRVVKRSRKKAMAIDLSRNVQSRLKALN
jgi:hypothetical protein